MTLYTRNHALTNRWRSSAKLKVERKPWWKFWREARVWLFLPKDGETLFVVTRTVADG